MTKITLPHRHPLPYTPDEISNLSGLHCTGRRLLAKQLYDAFCLAMRSGYALGDTLDIVELFLEKQGLSEKVVPMTPVEIVNFVDEVRRELYRESTHAA